MHYIYSKNPINAMPGPRARLRTLAQFLLQENNDEKFMITGFIAVIKHYFLLINV